ncbi:MAG: hypothetical protein AMXMBFR46_25940 [Acidimicrobiia bacterium]
MIRFSVLYPKTDGASFDHDYYRDRHIPLALATWGLDPANVSIEKGISGPYEAIAHFTFESPEALGAALGGEGMAAVGADVANYTTIQAVIQTSEIVS